MPVSTSETVLDFWFGSSVQPKWFNSDDDFDMQIIKHFESTYDAAMAGALNHWSDTPEGVLALVIVLDQFPLNMYRGQAKAFESESRAVEQTKSALAANHHESLNAAQQMFLYMPLIHSESIDNQNLAVKLFQAQNVANSDAYALHHRSIVERFGRFPHRNTILNRESTPAEIDYLNSSEAFEG